jgi:hypothetical protein
MSSRDVGKEALLRVSSPFSGETHPALAGLPNQRRGSKPSAGARTTHRLHHHPTRPENRPATAAANAG